MTRIRTILAAFALALFGAVAPLHYAPSSGLGYQAAQAQSLTDYAENKLIDAVFRGQALGAPATFYVGLATAASSCETGTITEVSTSGTGYSRAAVTSSLANWAGTQSSGSTTASSGSGGQTSNNSTIMIGSTATGSWGSVTHFFMADASSGGNIWVCQSLTTPKTINTSDPAPTFSAGALTVTFQ